MKETWQQRLQRYEATPPAQVWDRVESALQQDPASVAERLNAYEAAPPAGLWDRIEQQLDAPAVVEAPAIADAPPVVAMPRRRRTFYAYAVAASLLAIVLVGSALLLNRRHQERSIAIETKAPSKAAPLTREAGSDTAPNSSTSGTPDITPSVDAPDNSPLAATRRADDGAPRSARREPDFGLRDDRFASSQPIASAHRPVTGATASLDEDRYVVRAYNNGSTVRFSKKVSAVVDCAEHATGITQNLCKVSIGAVQEKMAASVSTDFGGLIERLQDLEKSR